MLSYFSYYNLFYHSICIQYIKYIKLVIYSICMHIHHIDNLLNANF